MRRLLVLALTLAISPLPIAISPSLAKETGEDRPVGSLGGAVHADPFTGVAATSIPIEVPPGRNGMQPNLSLIYNSASGNGWVGMGWDLEPEGIFRQTKWGVNYLSNTGGTAFSVTMAGVSNDLVPSPPPAPSTQWSATIESGFSRIEQLPASDGQIMWKVTTKQGRKHYFGETAASRQVQVNPANAANIFGWLLDRIEDPDGNYLTLSYWTDTANNQVYLDHIDYAGNSVTGTPTTNTTTFYRDAGQRLDQPDMYVTNYRIRTSYLLKTIATRSNGNLVRVYELNYTPSPSGSRSRLASVTQHGKDAVVDPNGTITSPGTVFPVTTFNYSADSQTFTDGSAWLSNWCTGGSQVTASEFNKNGINDLWCRNTSGGFSTAISNGSSTLTAEQNVFSGCTVNTAGDFNGDGQQDLGCITQYYVACPAGPRSLTCLTWVAWRANVQIAIATGPGTFAPPTTWVDPLCSWTDSNFSPPAYVSMGVGDFDGDGKQDIWCHDIYSVVGSSFNGTVVALSSGSSFGTPANWIANWCGANTPLGVGDFNGDGKSDLWCNGGGTTSVALSNGTNGFTGGGAWISNWCSDGITFGLADFNGDGKQDLYCHPTDGTTKIALSTGSSFIDGGNWITGWCSSGQFGTGDFNGDGKQDVYCHPSDGTTQVALSTGAAFTSSTAWFSSWCTTGSYGVGDFNGDGKADVYCFNGGTVSIARSGAGLVVPDLLTAVSNGLNGATALTYAPSTQWQNTQLPFPVQRVSAITTCDNWNPNAAPPACTGIPTTTTYSYSGGFYHSKERDLRGVNYVKVTGQAAATGDQIISETWFHQGSRLDAVAETVTELQADIVASTKGLPFRSKVTDQTGKVSSDSTTTYLADPDGVAPWFTPPAVVTTSIYDSAGVLVKQTQTESVSYDAYGNLTLAYNRGDFTNNNALTSDDTTMAVSFGNYDTTNWFVSFPTIQTTYAGLGTSGVLVAQTKYYYDGASSCTTPAGNLTPTKGHVTKLERYLDQGGTNPISGMAYNNYGSLTCTRDPLGNVTMLTYDSTSTFPLTSMNSLGHVTTTSYYGVNGVAMDTGLYGQAKSVTDPNSKTTTSTYDALGRTLTTTMPDGLVNTMAYNYGGAFVVGTQHVQSTTSGGGLATNLVSKTYFDGLGRTIKKESPGAADGGGSLKVLVIETQYDNRGLVKQTSLPYIQGTESATGRWRTMTYDAVGRMIQSTNPDGTSSQVCYNGWTTTTIDPKQHKKVETTDAYGRMSTVQEYTSTQADCFTTSGTLYATTNYQYDLLGNLLSVTDTKGNITTMTYDTLGRKLTMHDPDMSNWSYTYDSNGNLLTQVDAKSQKICFSYDALNRRTQKNYGTTTVACGTSTVVYTYDDPVAANNSKGRLKQVTDPAQSVTFQYDSRGRITQSAKTLDGTTYTTTSAYDGLGRLTTVSYPTNPITTVTYTYDGPQLKQVSEGATTYVTYAGWNALGQSATTSFGNGVVTTSTYANTNNVTCTQQTFLLCTLKTQGLSHLYQDLRYDYEANGNVWNIYDNTVANNAGDQHFSYDDLDRLTLANGPYGASGANATLPYSYDEIGNMTVNPQVGIYSYPASGPGSIRPHAVSVAGPYPLTYDNNGNVTTMTDPTGFYGYTASADAENHLTSVTTTYGGVPTTATFVYDGDGGRVKKIEGTTTTRYLSKLYECDTTGGATSCTRFIWAKSTRIATIASNGAVHYWHGDHLGSSSVITDSTGAKVQAITYFPYGDYRTNDSFTTPAIDVPYKYTGKERDASSNLYFYESRYYHPVFGRFVSPDTIVPNPRDPQSLNRYSYVENNPLRYIDPTGHQKCLFGVCFSKKDISTMKTVGGVVAEFIPGLQPLGVYLLTTTQTGRYILAGEILVGTAAASFYCGGCGAWATGAAIGAWSGAAIGGYSAVQNGGDLSSGILFGSSIGAVTGAFAGYAAPTGELFNSLSYIDKIIVSAKVGAILGAGSGATNGYAGGKGTIDDILKDTAIGIGTGAVTGAALQAAAPALSELASKVGDINLLDSGVKLRDFSDFAKNFSLHPGVPGPVQGFTDLVTDVGQFLDANRVLFIGGGAALGTGAVLNNQVLPFLQSRCTENSPCKMGGKF